MATAIESLAAKYLSPDPLVELTVYADDSRASGRVALSADRVTDLLNSAEQFTLVDLSAQSLEDGHELALPEAVVLREEMYAVAVTGPQGNPRRRLRTRSYPVELRLRRYDVSGHLHAFPGTDPVAGFFHRREVMVPLTEATIAYDSPAGRVSSRYDTLLVNRLLPDRIAPAWHSDVRPPGPASELQDQGLVAGMSDPRLTGPSSTSEQPAPARDSGQPATSSARRAGRKWGISMHLGVFASRNRPSKTQASTSSPAGLRLLTPEQEARAQAEMAASDEPAFDWPGAVAVCVELTRQGWMARAKFVGAWDRWIIEARQKAWPPDQWGTVRKDGRVLCDGLARAG